MSCMQGSGKDLIQPVLDNQLKAASPLLIPAKVQHHCLNASMYRITFALICMFFTFACPGIVQQNLSPSILKDTIPCLVGVQA